MELLDIIKLFFYVFKTKPDFIYIILKIYLYNSKNMKKLKWHFDKENNQWFVNESYPFERDGCLIRRTGNKRHPDYTLTFDNLMFSLYFRKLSSAKVVAYLIKNG